MNRQARGSAGFYLLVALFALMALVQSTVTSHIRLVGVSPDIVLLMAVAWVILRGSGEGIAVSLVGGLMLDALSGAPFGVATAALVLASYVIGLGAINVFRGAASFPFAAAALATVLYDLGFSFLLRITGRPIAWGATLWRLVLPGVVVNALFMVPVYYLMARLSTHMQPLSVEWE